MAKKKGPRLRTRVIVDIYYPDSDLPITHKPQYSFQGELLKTKETESIFFYLRKALRMEKARIAKERREENDDTRTEPESRGAEA